MINSSRKTFFVIIAAFLLSFPLFVKVSYAAEFPEDAIAYWQMNEENADVYTVYDSTVNSYHGTRYGAAQTSDGECDYALSFDGDNDYVSTPLNIDQGGSTPYTFEAWVYPTSISSGKHQVISTDNGGDDWSILRKGATWWVFTGATEWNTLKSVDVGKWQHVVAVFDPGSGVKFYKNVYETDTISTIDYDSADNNVCIGVNPGDWTEYFDGVIDEVVIYDYALTAEEVAERYWKTWQDIVDDTRITSVDAWSRFSSLGLDSSGNVHIAWHDSRDGDYEIYYTKLYSNGNDAVDDTRITSAGGNSLEPSLGVDSSGNIHISWEDDRDGNAEIYYTKLYSNGTTAVDDTRITSDDAISSNPSLGVDSSGNVHIAWHDTRDGNYEIYYSKLYSDGTTLVDDTRLTSDSATSRLPSLGLDSSGNIHIAWEDDRDGNWEIYYTKLYSDGSDAVDDTRITSYIRGSIVPNLGLDSSGNVHIAWVDYRDINWEIYYTKLDNNGITTVDDTRITSDSAGSWSPSLGVDSSGNVHIAWWERLDENNSEIYYTMLDNNGNTEVDDSRITFDGAHSLFPSLGLDNSDDVHISWHDTRDVKTEIYYIKGEIVPCE